MSGRPRPADMRRLARRVETRDAEDDRVLDRRDLLDPEADRCRRIGPGRDAVGDVGRRADRFAGHDDQPRVERGVIDGDPVETFAHLEVDALAPVLERDPAPVGPQLQARPAKDERTVGVVLELLLGVDPAADPDVAGRPGGQWRAPRRSSPPGVAARRRPTR